MRLQAVLIAGATTVLAQGNFTTGQLGDALQNFNNPPGAAYRAVLAENGLGITGSVTAVSAGDSGVQFAVEFDNLPAEGGPFPYHLHVMPITSDGNCTSALAHLDPFIRGETPACSSNQPATCQVGDLSGKHGFANGTSFRASYTDTYVSLTEGMGAFFGNRSFVVHFANTSRIACGNFSSLSDDEMATMSMPPLGTSTSTLSDGTATLVPSFTNSSAVETSASSMAASKTGKASLTTSTTIVGATGTSGGGSSTTSAKPAQESNNSASMAQARAPALLVAVYAGLWALI